VARAVDVIGDRWSLLIVRDAFDGVRRFGEFQANLGIARNILTERLRMLVDAGVLETVPASDGSAYHDYAMTARGLSLFPVIVTLRQWGEQHLFARSEPHSTLLERDSGKSVPVVEVKGRDGMVIRPEKTYVKKLGEQPARV
jgi:DNA-binding HxlR family transcriptional regulator